jgi:hypothetical protein
MPDAAWAAPVRPVTLEGVGAPGPIDWWVQARGAPEPA